MAVPCAVELDSSLHDTVVGGFVISRQRVALFREEGEMPNCPRVGTLQCLVVTATVVMVSQNSIADEGGVSYWLLGLFGSLASVPGEPVGPCARKASTSI
jgi:hypothetical protein